MQYIKRLILFISFILLYFIGKEALELYTNLYAVNPYLGYALIIAVVLFLVYFAGIPIYKIISLPVNIPPAKSRDQESEVVVERLKRFRENPYFREIGFETSTEKSEREQYDECIERLSEKCVEIRKRYVNQLFLSTAVSQNGFLDAILILSANTNMIKEIFYLYNGRTSNRDLVAIGVKVYYSMAISGSEAIEYATEEVFSKLSTETMKSIPFIDKIISSLADGFVNATLLTRISYITENYCKLTYIEKDRDLMPRPQFIKEVVKNLTSDSMEMIKENLRKMRNDKFQKLLKNVNPMSVLVGKSKLGAYKKGV